MRHSSVVFTSNVTSANMASTDATAVGIESKAKGNGLETTIIKTCCRELKDKFLAATKGD